MKKIIKNINDNDTITGASIDHSIGNIIGQRIDNVGIDSSIEHGNDGIIKDSSPASINPITGINIK